MQIIIPMSGIGQRFINAGFETVKPLIKVDGRPIIEHVINLFSRNDKFIFICNDDHLKQTNLRDELRRIVPNCKIIGIEPHKKGPVYAVAQAFNYINDDEEVIVNYCDFGKYWNYQEFLNQTRQRKASGAICAYKGFHPHMLGTTNYAFIREEGQWMQAIQEKKPFTKDRMREYASDGTYYFQRGFLVKKYFKQLLDNGPDLNGEYYISLVYNLMVADRLKIFIYEIEHMLQWGEPKDLQEYQKWSDYFREMTKPPESLKESDGLNLIPLAGRGSRFAGAGYEIPKPLIRVNGKPMILQASAYLPLAQRRTFICLGDHLDQFSLESEIKQTYPQANIVRIDRVTEGQACTCELGLTKEDMQKPLLIAASDNGMLWNAKKYQQLIDEGVDCIVWSFCRHPSSALNPQMYGWIRIDDNDVIKKVSVKVPISDNPFEDHAIIGAFYFKKAQYFLDALNRLYEKNTRVNNEFYVDSCVNEIVDMGLKAKVFEVDHYVCWGTPDDLKTYEYWQKYFHKSKGHPYSMESDWTAFNSHVEEAL